MADGVIMNAGSGGSTAATDDCGAAGHAQVVKLAISTDGSATLIPADATNGIDVDVTRVIPGTSANNLGKAEDAAHSSGDTGVMALTVRQDTPAALGQTDGDYQPPITDANGRLHVIAALAASQTLATVTAVTAITNALPAGNNNIGDVDIASIVPGTGATNMGKAEDAAHTSGDVGIMALCVRADTPAALGADGDYMPAIVDSSGRQWVAAVQSGTWTVTLAAGTNTNEVVGDAAHDAAAAGNPLLMGGYASAAAPTDVSADGDAVRAWLLRSGAVAIQPTFAGVLGVAGNGASGTGVQRVTIANDSTGVLATVTTVTTVSTVTTLTGGGVAHDSADSGNPVKVGAKAALTLADDTMVSDADRTNLVSDADGALITRPMVPLGDVLSEAVSNTDGNSTAFSTFGATANTRSYVTAYSIFRTDNGTTPIYVDFRDGTGGSVLWRVVIPPNGGANMASPMPLFKTTANTALAFDVSAATSTVYISIAGFKSKVVA